MTSKKYQKLSTKVILPLSMIFFAISCVSAPKQKIPFPDLNWILINGKGCLHEEDVQELKEFKTRYE